jgi:hypothetical protein
MAYPYHGTLLIHNMEEICAASWIGLKAIMM